MESDSLSMIDENGESEITRENRNLEEKYLDLIKEIEEKSALMDSTLADKGSGTTKIETQMIE